MNFLYTGVNVSTLAALAMLMGALLLVNELTRRSKWFSIVVFGLLPVALALGIFFGPLGSPTGRTWFAWVKVVSALAGVYGFLLIRHTKLGISKFAAYFPPAILALNIAEAVYRELEVYATYTTLSVDAGGVVVQGGIWNIFNGIAGILTIITLTGFVGIRVSRDSSRDMIWPDMTWMYIIGYTLWNYTYVYNCISTRSMYAGFGILLAAVIAEYFFKRGAWLQHRAQILSLYAMFSLSVDFQSSAFFQILPTYNTSIMLWLAALSLLVNVVLLGYTVVSIKRTNRNPIKEEVFMYTTGYKKTLAANHLS